MILGVKLFLYKGYLPTDSVLGHWIFPFGEILFRHLLLNQSHRLLMYLIK